MSSARINLSNNTEDLLNQQINAELTAGYTYCSMAAFFARDNVALNGFRCYFTEGSRDCWDKAHKLSNYMTLRGGRIQHREIPFPQVKQIYLCLISLGRMGKSRKAIYCFS